jgi:hypothetical protein
MADTLLTIKKDWAELSVRYANMDVSLEQYFSALKGMLVTLGWREDIIDDFIIESGRELEEIRSFKDNQSSDLIEIMEQD